MVEKHKRGPGAYSKVGVYSTQVDTYLKYTFKCLLSHHTVGTTFYFLSVFVHHGICIVFSDISKL